MVGSSSGGGERSIGFEGGSYIEDTRGRQERRRQEAGGRRQGWLG